MTFSKVLALSLNMLLYENKAALQWLDQKHGYKWCEKRSKTELWISWSDPCQKVNWSPWMSDT